MLCVLVKILSRASAKKKTKRIVGFKFRTFMLFSNGIMAVRGLKLYLYIDDLDVHGEVENGSRLGTLLCCLVDS